MARISERDRWRSIWISDLHLGSRHSQVDALLEFLKRTRTEHLYLVGDFIDGWELRRGWTWGDSANTLIQKILRKSRKGTRVTYVTGNHDEFLEPFLGLAFGRLHLVDRVIHEAADGRRYLVIHGHQFDGLTHFNRLLERLGAHAYEHVLNLNRWLNLVRRRLGMGYWSFSAYLKNKAKAAVQYVTEYERAMLQLARAEGVDGVICGHIHRAELSVLDEIAYMNCEDWVESCTALVEDFSGNFSLIYYHEDLLHSAGRGTGALDAGARHRRSALPAGA